ncbi:ABC transporter ATP-binding protein [Meiothermus sp.]|uniref:ABC transporter ATP-binding protein n=1 Tax=Meiothermus sp. TaxID=1955249 RepID=UPI0021DE2771|nr:ABC transporter ATP-binding protein [Meiothermus sp.]GIW34146.1 MAG: sugar ABC transporter ATP-binding protein [Meiothermus sp.]
MTKPMVPTAEAMPTQRNALEMRGVSKRFPLVQANQNVDFSVRWGEVHALVGENGAGKSTLMKILYGIQRPDAGEIWIDGEKRTLRDPHDAIALGIGMVHQNFTLVEPFSVLENVILGHEPTAPLGLDMAEARRRVEALVRQFEFQLDLDRRVEDLPVGLRQKVEILKALYRQARILILDEPTAVLTPQETDDLFRFLREYAAQGNAAVFISHKLLEVIQVSDRISVMRDGRMIGTIPTPGATLPQIARMMVGREVEFRVEKGPAHPGEAVLEVTHLTVAQAREKPLVRDVSFAVRAGEIVGIAGVQGNGQSELVEALTGLRPYTGEVRFLGRSLDHGDPHRVRRAGVSHIPEDRNQRGLVMGFTSAENLILGDHNQPPYAGPWGFLNQEVIEQTARQRIEAFDIRPRSTTLSADRFSGGNAQKIIVARELSRNPRLLIAAQPTRGIDIGATEFVHEQIVRARDRGVAVLLVSADLGEIMALSDRILVMYEGQIVGELPAQEATEEKLGLLMAGVKT